MDYERKYKDALEWMRSLYDGLHGATKEEAEHYFPELKENKSERVRKGLIKTISSLLDNTVLYHTDITKEEALAWLGKQGENKSTDDKTVFAKYFPELKESEDERIKDEILRLVSISGNGNQYEEIRDWIEKQGEKLDADKVIAWLVANICDFEYYVKLFKEDFGLC